MSPTTLRLAAACSIAAVLGLPAAAQPQGHDDAMHQHLQAAAPSDSRMAVRFPEPLRSHTLANMRDHLLSLGQIQEALSRGDYDTAAEITEKRLGMSSLEAHGAHDVARYMPRAMQDAGSAMHRSASQFAVVAKDASVTGDWKSVVGALARVNQACVACHAAFRLE